MTRKRISGTALLLLTLLALPSCRTMGGDNGADGRANLAAAARGRGGADAQCRADRNAGARRQLPPRRRQRHHHRRLAAHRQRAHQTPAGALSSSSGPSPQRSSAAAWPASTASSSGPAPSATGTPVRVGERVALIGDMEDDVSGLALARPLPRGCAGRRFRRARLPAGGSGRRTVTGRRWMPREDSNLDRRSQSP